MRSVLAPWGTPTPRHAPHPGWGTLHAPPPELRTAQGAPSVEGARDRGPAPPPAQGLARAHPSRPGPAVRGLAGPRGCSWALLETSNAGSDSSQTARMQEPPLPPPLHPTPPPSAEPKHRQSERASRPGSGRRTELQRPSRPRTRHTDRHTAQSREGWARRGRAQVQFSAGRLQGRSSVSHQHPNSDSQTQLTRGPGDKDTHGAQEARGAPTQTPWRCAGGHGRRRPKQEPAKQPAAHGR